MAVWSEVLKQAVRLLPELHRLMPLLERMTSTEAREEQRNRILATAGAAGEAREAAESARQSVMEATRRLSSQHADLVARLDSCEQRTKEASQQMRTVAAAQTALTAKLNSAMVWIKTTALLGLILLALLIVLLLRR